VYIERWRIRNRFLLSAVSLAGPIANLLVAVVLGLVLRYGTNINPSWLPGLSFLLVLQVSAVLFNSIPLPPFDGYNVLEPFLPESVRIQVDRFRDITIWIIFLLFWFVPAFSNSFWSTVFGVSTALGVDLNLAIQGLQRFRFWEL